MFFDYNFRKVLCLLLALSTFGCLPISAPSIDYENISHGGRVVRNIKVRFNRFYPMGHSEAQFCGGSINIHHIDSYDNLFGPVHIEWENAKGEKLTKDLIFTKEQLPSIKTRKAFLSSIYLYFTQDDVYLYTSDTPNLQQIRDNLFKKAGLTCREYRDRENKRLWGTTNSDDPIEIYEAIPNDSPLKKDPKFIEEYKKEKAKRAKK